MLLSGGRPLTEFILEHRQLGKTFTVEILVQAKACPFSTLSSLTETVPPLKALVQTSK